jgi:hypothetical protein
LSVLLAAAGCGPAGHVPAAPAPRHLRIVTYNLQKGMPAKAEGT